MLPAYSAEADLQMNSPIMIGVFLDSFRLRQIYKQCCQVELGPHMGGVQTHSPGKERKRICKLTLQQIRHSKLKITSRMLDLITILQEK